jgi:dihydrofolate reductase
MRKLVSYMFTSLDGFIADREGELDWVPVDDELMLFANAYFSSADGIVFGRNVYEGFVSYWDELNPADPSVTEHEVAFAKIFGKMTRIVASRTLRKVADDEAILINDDVAPAISTLKRQPGKDLLLICGAELRATLTQHDLIDRHRVLVAPVVLGAGQPLFGEIEDVLRLRLVETKVFSGGVVLHDYDRIPNG